MICEREQRCGRGMAERVVGARVCGRADSSTRFWAGARSAGGGSDRVVRGRRAGWGGGGIGNVCTTEGKKGG